MEIQKSNTHESELIHFSNLVNLALVDNKCVIENNKVLNKFREELHITNEEYSTIIENSSKYPIKIVDSVSKRLEYIYDYFTVLYADRNLRFS